MSGAIAASVAWFLASQFVHAQDGAGTAEPDAAVAEAIRSDSGTAVVGLDGGMASATGPVDGGVADAAGPDTPPASSDARIVEADLSAVQGAGIASREQEPGAPVTAAVAAQVLSPRSSLWSSAAWGLGADIGLSGPLLDAGLLLAWRPSTWIHLHAGGGYNGFAYGVRGGATVINPFAVPLSVTCEAGHYFEGDANKAVRWFSNDAPEIASLRRFSYDYLNLLGGLEFGGRNFSIYLRGGVTWMRTTIQDFAQSVHDASQVDLQASNPKVMYRGPAFKIGTRYFF